MKFFMPFLVFMVLAFLPYQAFAQDFAFPVDCTLGGDCWVLSYVDMDTAQGAASDYTCAARSSDDNKGTDIAIANRKVMERGVDVLAAADGSVFRLRNGESDAVKSEQDLVDVKARNRDCGNGIVLDHGDGLQSVYCHLKEDSIVVAQDQRVTKGQKIAQIGGSGYSEMPHLHFGVIQDGAIIDPFSGLSPSEKCGAASKSSLWADDAITYQAMGIFDAGFRTSVPDFEVIKEGENNPETLPRGAEALTFWAGYFGALKGDKIAFKITRPDGSIFVERSYTQNTDSLRQYYYTGRKITGGRLAVGAYTASVTITRGDTQESMTRILNVVE